MLVDRGLDGNEVLADLRELDLEVVALDRAQAEAAGLPRSATRDAGLSLGDGPAWLDQRLRSLIHGGRVA